MLGRTPDETPPASCPACNPLSPAKPARDDFTTQPNEPGLPKRIRRGRLFHRIRKDTLSQRPGRVCRFHRGWEVIRGIDRRRVF